MVGKYDGRRFNGSTKERRRANPNLGPKPAWLKSVTRNSAYHVLRELDDKASWKQIYQAAWEKNQLALCIDVLRYLTDRRDGRPFTAENPAISKQSAALAQDNRLQVAIQNLVLTPGAKQTAPKGKKVKQLAAPVPTVEATHVPDDTQPAGEPQE